MTIGFSLARLRSFVAIVEEKQFRRAAERIGISQPALSAHVSELEEFLGAPLLSRTTRSVRLTAEGEKFFNRARNILADIDSAVLEVRDHASLRRGRVTVAAIPTAASQLLPRIVAGYTARLPGIEVNIIEAGASAVERCVASGEADLGVAPQPDRASELSFACVIRDRFVGLVPRRHPLARARRARLQSFLDYPLITTVPGTSIRTVLERVLLEQGRRLRVTHAVTQHQTVIEMVAAGLGVSLLPGLTVGPQAAHQGVRIVPVVEPRITRDLGIVQRKGEALSAAAQEFIETLRAARAPRP